MVPEIKVPTLWSAGGLPPLCGGGAGGTVKKSVWQRTKIGRGRSGAIRREDGGRIGGQATRTSKRASRRLHRPGRTQCDSPGQRPENGTQTHREPERAKP